MTKPSAIEEESATGNADEQGVPEELIDEGSPTEEKVNPEPGSDLAADFIRQIDQAIEEGDEEQVTGLCKDLHPADVADLLEQLAEGPRAILVAMLGEDFAPSTLVELDEDVRDDVIEKMPTEQLAEAVSELDTDDAAFVLEDMEEEARAEVLAEVPMAERLALQAALDFEEDTAGRLMQRDVFAAPSYWTVGQIIDRLRTAEDLPDKFYEVYVIDPAFKILGSIALSRFLRADRDIVISDLIRDDDNFRIPVDMDQEEVAYIFEKYNLISAPVIDKGERLVGMITVDDVVEIVHEESVEDMLALAGVEADQSGVSGSLSGMLQSRFYWLAINLLTAILAAIVISFFGATIEQAVALAVLMPIVASMGGVAGTQTLTVAVRNLATKDLTTSNAVRIVGRETLVGFLNGLAFAVIMGFLAGLWYSTIGGGGTLGEGAKLASVLGGAMIINLICAGLAGILVPIGLQKMGADPAVSSAVFVTTVTDVIGFFSFLGLAALFLV
jgi:magnesium transporter